MLRTNGRNVSLSVKQYFEDQPSGEPSQQSASTGIYPSGISSAKNVTRNALRIIRARDATGVLVK